MELGALKASRRRPPPTALRTLSTTIGIGAWVIGRGKWETKGMNESATYNSWVAVAALIVVALGFYFIEVYAPSPAIPTLSAAIQQDSIPIGSMTREFLEYVPHDISPHSPLVIVLHGALMDAKSMPPSCGSGLPCFLEGGRYLGLRFRSRESCLGLIATL
jgi:hypothetical protein